MIRSGRPAASRNDSIPPMQKPTTPRPSPVTASWPARVVDRGTHVASGAIGRELGHQLRGLVHLVVTGELAVIEVGSERDEAGAPEPFGHLLDPGVEAPPLLDHDHSGPGAARRPDQVAGRGVTVAREFDAFSHERES